MVLGIELKALSSTILSLQPTTSPFWFSYLSDMAFVLFVHHQPQTLILLHILPPSA
jgi:hypothetical protein